MVLDEEQGFSREQELAEDILSIIHVYSRKIRLYPTPKQESG
jgi:hypothetical protein